MRPFVLLYRRFDLLQRRAGFRIAASALVVMVCGAFFGALLLKSYDLDGQRQELVAALTNQSLPEGGEHALSLDRTGEVVVGGRTYGEPSLREQRNVIFDEQGTIANPAALAERLLLSQRPAWAPPWMLDQPLTTWMIALAALAWLLLVVWLGLSGPMLLTLLGCGVPLALGWLVAGPGEPLQRWPVIGVLLSILARPHVQLFIAGLGLLLFTFVLLTRVALVLTNWPRQIPAVAHAVIKEASRTNLSLVFIVLLLVMLPLLPIWLDPASPLRFQIQTFIARSMTLTFALAACMTLFLSCATVAFEIRDRQIWQVLTKPVSRFKYLVGKWLGVVSVNLIILLVSGVSIFIFIQYLRSRPVAPGLRGQLDALSVRDEVLTARRAIRPQYEELSGPQLLERVKQTIERTPELANVGEVPLAMQQQLGREIQDAYLLGQRTIRAGNGYRTYVFRGLDAARRLRSSLALKYQFHILRSDEHEAYEALFVFNNDQRLAVRRTYVPTVAHVLSIPPALIQEDGTLAITIVNRYEPPPDMLGMGALNFEEDGLELMYKVGDFEPNFFRAMLLNWVKLSFLAMMGICAATVLSFPVACLFAFTVFIGGAMAPFLAHSLEQWYPPPAAVMDWTNVGMVIRFAFSWFVKGVAEAIVFGLRAFGEYSASQLLVEGDIPWSGVLSGVLKLGVVWSGATLVVGWLVMRSRQLAIYSGQGG